MISFWDKHTYFNNPDYTIIGAGFTGLQSALALREKLPSATILVVDRDFLGGGASNRNAGFGCYGSPSELADDLTREPMEAVVSRAVARYNGLQKLLRNVSDHHIGWQPHAGYELFRKSDQEILSKSLKHLPELNEALAEALGFEPYRIFSSTKLPFAGITHAISIKNEGQLNASLTLHALRMCCLQQNIQLVFGVDIEDVSAKNQCVTITSKDIEWQTKAVLLATNAFSHELLPNTDIIPARGQVLITEPLSEMPFSGTFHLEEGYYYFRNVGNRILLGGGRNTDFQTEFTDVNELNQNIQRRLEFILYQHIAPNVKIVIEHRWTGIMAFGNHHEKEPIIAESAPGIFVAARLGGMGVALSAQVAEQAALLLAQNN